MPRTKAQNRLDRLDIRLEQQEKEAFQAAASLAGTPLATWVRERLRSASRRELEAVDKAVPFLPRRISS
jgi:hypothetical protein